MGETEAVPLHSLLDLAYVRPGGGNTFMAGDTLDLLEARKLDRSTDSTVRRVCSLLCRVTKPRITSCNPGLEARPREGLSHQTQGKLQVLPNNDKYTNDEPESLELFSKILSNDAAGC